MKSLKSVLCHRLLSTLLAGGLMLAASSPAVAQGRPVESIALSGEQAQAFTLPAGVELVRSTPTAFGLVSERYQQRRGAARVLGAQITIYRNADGTAATVIGAYYPNLQTRNQVRLKLAEARSVVETRLGKEGDWLGELLLDPQTGLYVWQVENRRPESRWFYWVDAENARIVRAYDGLTTGQGIGVTGDTKNLAGLTTLQGSTYSMLSSDRRQTTHDAQNRPAKFLQGPIATDADDNWNAPGTASPGQPAIVDAQFNARVTDNFYLTTFNFNWLTPYPQGMVSLAHVKRNYNNAFWNGSVMSYGDGDGTNFIELSGDLDVVGHELSHGVTEATSHLVYQNESGALNEAFSDIMGTSIEFFYGSGNWTIGEDVTPGTNGIRNMANPNEDGQPSYYADRYTGTSDNGGVHTNSGIANHWFYLLSQGGQNANPTRATGTSVVGIGVEAARRIAFLGFTGLPETANHCVARSATIATATPLGFQNNVAAAWNEVGVNTTLCGQ